MTKLSAVYLIFVIKIGYNAAKLQFRSYKKTIVMAISAERIALMVRLGKFFRENREEWHAVAELAERMNGWFTQAFIDLAIEQIANAFLNEEKLEQWLLPYHKNTTDATAKRKVGLVMAGNIPLVGFHDFLCVYLSGHNLVVKLSSKDTVLWEYIFSLLSSWDSNFGAQVQKSEMLKGCDAYIATGSNNSARYFEQYFQKYPHIIRRNRTSVAILDGTETVVELEKLAADVCTYYGLGCRNVTKIFVPEGYDFQNLLNAFNAYEHYLDHNKYKNNYDYQLALALLNKMPYMTNGTLLLLPSEHLFAAISTLNYSTYTNKENLLQQLIGSDEVQCITLKSKDNEMTQKVQLLGENQQPKLDDYADGVDTMAFLMGL